MSVKSLAEFQPGEDGLRFANELREGLVCGIILVDARGRLATVTPEAAAILGLNPEQIQAGSLEVLPAPLRAVVRGVVASGRPLARRQIELAGNRGGRLTLRVHAVPLPPGDAGSGVALTLTDLTAARELASQIRQLDRLANLGTLAAGMAHEIRNSLVAGKTFIDLLLEKHRDAELVEIVRRELGRVDAIVGRMLRFAGHGPSEFATVRLHEVLDHSLRLVQPQLQGKALLLERVFRATTDRVNGDDYQLQQAFVNLLLNALEAMGAHGTLTVATESLWPGGKEKAEGAEAASASTELPDRAEPPQLRVTVSDTGAGIPPENLERLFEPFFTTKPSGTGLGLAITQRIIQEHGGAIAVESQPGQGTVFTIVLPSAPVVERQT